MRLKCVDALMQGGPAQVEARVGPLLDRSDVDTIDLAQAEKEFFRQCLRRRDDLELLADRGAALDQGSVPGRLVDVGPASDSIEGMCPGAKSKVGLANPIF